MVLGVLSACGNQSTSASGLEPQVQGRFQSGERSEAQQTIETSITTYYTGTQKLNPAQTVPCFVELKSTEVPTSYEMRAILTQPHLAESVGIGSLVLQQKFLGGSIQSNGYSYDDATPGAIIKQVIVFGDASNPFQEMRAALLHEGHHDPVSCGQLQLVTQDQVDAVKANFDNFDELVENLTGEHEHDHDQH